MDECFSDLLARAGGGSLSPTALNTTVFHGDNVRVGLDLDGASFDLFGGFTGDRTMNVIERGVRQSRIGFKTEVARMACTQQQHPGTFVLVQGLWTQKYLGLSARRWFPCGFSQVAFGVSDGDGFVRVDAVL